MSLDTRSDSKEIEWVQDQSFSVQIRGPRTCKFRSKFPIRLEPQNRWYGKRSPMPEQTVWIRFAANTCDRPLAIRVNDQ